MKPLIPKLKKDIILCEFSEVFGFDKAHSFWMKNEVICETGCYPANMFPAQPAIIMSYAMDAVVFASTEIEAPAED